MIFGERMLGEGDGFAKEKNRSKKRETFLSKLPKAFTLKECYAIFKDRKAGSVRQMVYRLTELGLLKYDEKARVYHKRE